MKFADWGGGAYVSPSVRVVDFVSEGVLCSSGIDIDDWEWDDDFLDF